MGEYVHRATHSPFPTLINITLLPIQHFFSRGIRYIVPQTLTAALFLRAISCSFLSASCSSRRTSRSCFCILRRASELFWVESSPSCLWSRSSWLRSRWTWFSSLRTADRSRSSFCSNSLTCMIESNRKIWSQRERFGGFGGFLKVIRVRVSYCTYLDFGSFVLLPIYSSFDVGHL